MKRQPGNSIVYLKSEPIFSDKRESFWDRWVALEFPKTFPVDTEFEDRTFTDKNLSVFFNVVLTKMREIIKSGGIKVTDSAEPRWLNDASSCQEKKMEMHKQIEQREKQGELVDNDHDDNGIGFP